MDRVMRLVLGGFLICTAGTLFPLAARAELSPNELNAELLKTRDKVKAPLETWQANVTKKTQDEFDAVKAKLAETWKEGRAQAVQKAVGELASRRQAITDLLAGDPERLDRVSKKLKEEFDRCQQTLAAAGKKFDADADAFQVPTGADAKTKALEKLTELANAALAPVSATEWGKVFDSVSARLAEPTGEEKVKEAAVSVQKFIDSVERDFARIVHCTYTEKTGTLVCDRALAVSAAEISTIEISGLPHNQEVTVSAQAAKDAPTEIDNGQIDPESDFVVLPPGRADKVSIDVHLLRKWNATYKEGFLHPTTTSVGKEDRRVTAARSLRQLEAKARTPRRSLVLIISGRAPQITVQVKIGSGLEAGRLVTASLELGYARWGIDSGGFFAITALSDEKLATEPVEGSTSPNKVKIKRRGGGSDLSEDTGIFLNLVPKNYPILGIGIGFSANENQANTFYLGPSIRLLSFRSRGVASFSIGATLRSVKRFPGLDEGMTVSASDPRLQGTSQIKVAPYAIVQLGFAFGRVPGAQSGE